MWGQWRGNEAWKEGWNKLQRSLSACLNFIWGQQGAIKDFQAVERLSQSHVSKNNSEIRLGRQRLEANYSNIR